VSKKLQSNSSDVMEALLAKYGSDVKSYKTGDKVKGKILRIDDDRVILDINAKSEGLVAEKAFKEAHEFIKSLKVGDEVEARVLVPETQEGFTILSLRAATQDANWAVVEESYQSGQEISVIIRGVTNAGLTADVNGMTGFLPLSQVGKALIPEVQNLVGETIVVKIFDIDREKHRVILSEKEVSEKAELAQMREAMEQINIGDVYEGEVVSISDFGCFVKLPVILEKGKKGEEVAVEGLVHVSQLSWSKVGNPSEIVSVGDTVKVLVIEKRDGKLALSMKQAQDDPWSLAAGKYPVETRATGMVTKVSDYGVFVQLEAGIEGLIHMTKIPPGHKYEVGNEVNVYVEEIDVEAKKISLGLVLTSKPLGYK
jgi:small subunit ribosomal protein S1